MSEDGALWGAIFEKSFAKYLGNYETIDAGWGAHGIEAMTGSPFESILHWELQNKEELWDKLLESNFSKTLDKLHDSMEKQDITKKIM